MKRKVTFLYALAFFIIFYGVLHCFYNIVLWAATVDLDKTGQTPCADKEISCEGSGQIGDIQIGVEWPQPRFHDNDDGTITDNLTGLMWLKDSLCFKGYMTSSAAREAIANFNKNQTRSQCVDYTAHYTDWVLPDVNELASLINTEHQSSAGWLEEQSFVNLVGYGDFWTSTSTPKDIGNKPWFVSLIDNQVAWTPSKTYKYVLPVRSTTSGPAQVLKTGQTLSYFPGDDGDLQRGVNWPSPRFKDNNDGTVTDNPAIPGPLENLPQSVYYK